jgi:hypothetical protein
VNYRTNAPPAPRVLRFRPDPLASTLLVVLCAPIPIVFGLTFLAFFLGGTTTDTDGKPASPVLGILVAIACCFFGLVTTYAAYVLLTTVVRFTVEGADVRIDWLRRGRVVKHEELALGDIHEIAIVETPSSGGGVLHRLVVGTKHRGEIALSWSSTSQSRFYRDRAALLTSFLDLPAPPP